jgi:hypothetical protein
MTTNGKENDKETSKLVDPNLSTSNKRHRIDLSDFKPADKTKDIVKNI